MAHFETVWEAPEFEYREKDISWYWISIIIAACIIAFAVWERNFLFGFFIIVAEVLVILWGNETPRTVTFSLTESYLEIGPHKSYSLKEFESWSVDVLENGFIELGFNFHGKFKVPLKILAPEGNLDEIRANLKTILREVEHKMSFLEAIEKLLKF